MAGRLTSVWIQVLPANTSGIPPAPLLCWGRAQVSHWSVWSPSVGEITGVNGWLKTGVPLLCLWHLATSIWTQTTTKGFWMVSMSSFPKAHNTGSSSCSISPHFSTSNSAEEVETSPFPYIGLSLTVPGPCPLTQLWLIYPNFSLTPGASFSFFASSCCPATGICWSFYNLACYLY